MSQRQNLLLLAALLVHPFTCGAWQQAPGPELRVAVTALEHSDFQAAESALRGELAAHPGNAWALSLMGAALDSLNRSADADDYHRRAIAAAPRVTGILNNFAAHLWFAGKHEEAGGVYRRIVAIEPANYGANLQLSRLALDRKNGQEALRALDRIASAEQSHPQVLLSRLEALCMTGDHARADTVTARLAELSRTDSNLAIAAGTVLSKSAQFVQAESFFETALRQVPASFEALSALGIAATGAGHYDRAREVLEASLREQPQNIDALYALAFVHYSQRRWDAAVQLLSQAARLDPSRPDVQRLLAAAATDLGALEDASAAWDRYLKLRPDDAVARRERGYTAVQRASAEEGIADLEWYVARYPNDAVGHYELGQAERSRDLAKAIGQFDRALTIDPKYVPALAARAALYNQQGEPEKAVQDLERAAALRPDDAAVLDRLGQTYQALDRTADALPVLRKAAGLAPGDSKTLLHFARALAESGNTDESKTVMDRFRQLGPEKRSGVPAGFVEYLALSDAQRHADYQTRLEKAVRDHPGDAAVRVEYLKLLLADRRLEQAAKVAHEIAAMPADGAVLADAGRALLSTGQYDAACELFRKAEAAAPPATVGVDLAVAAHLAAAEKQQQAGNIEGAVNEWRQALEAEPDRSATCQQAAGFLVRNGRAPDALRLLDRAAARFANDRQILLLRAVAADLAGDDRAAEDTLAEIRRQWPEWHAGWAAQGMIHARHHRFDEARKALETAIALGAAGPDVYACLAQSALESDPPDGKTAEAAIQQARRLSPGDPWILALARHDPRSGRAPEDPQLLLRLFR